MSKIKHVLTILIVVLLAIITITTTPIYASSATTYTTTINANGKTVRTQDAYLPDKVLTTLGLSKPEDIFFDDKDQLWIADTGNRRIIKLNPNTFEIVQEITHDEFRLPRGIYVSNRGIYVADSSAKTVFRFTETGELNEKFETPDSPSFKDTPFAPSKLVVDNRGNIYINSEGVNNGIIQLSNTGEFLGFFTTNKVKLSFSQQILKRILSEAQFDRLAIRSPQTFSSIFIDTNSMIYTTTASTKSGAVKKHNMQGGNIFGDTYSSDDAIDIYVDHNGMIYSGMQSGSIYVYDQAGEYIYNFGVSKQDSGKITDDIAGIFTKLSSLAVRTDGKIYALDNEKSFLQVFRPTAYANGIYDAINLYEKREYEQAINAWNEVLKLNQMSIIAHNNIAKSYLQLENYEKANEHFKLAGNKEGYSESFWELRNFTIQNVLGIAIIIAAAIYVLSKGLVVVNNKTGIITKKIKPLKEKLKSKTLSDILYVFRVMKSPSDSFYELKRNNKGSLLSAVIIYIIVFIIFIFYSSGKGFIYQDISSDNLDLSVLVLGYFIFTLLFVLANYLDTSLHDGIGNIKQIFIMIVYSFGPIAISLLLTTVLSYILTYNEVFFLNSIMTIGGLWTVILIFLGIIETHEYSGKKAFLSMLMSVLFTLIIIIVIIIILPMWQELIRFIETILKELIRNVFN